MRVLNLYAGIGGNRKFWTNCDATAIELNKNIAEIYKLYYPNDTIIIDDAHQCLLDHYKEYDFIWSSPPCPTHSRTQIMSVLSESKRAGCDKRKAVYPEMSLYQEIILLKTFALKKTKWVVENVIPYYETLIEGVQLGRHIFWSNFKIYQKNVKEKEERINYVTGSQERFGFKLDSYTGINKRKILRNLVNPGIDLYIFNEARGIMTDNEKTLFENIM